MDSRPLTFLAIALSLALGLLVSTVDRASGQSLSPAQRATYSAALQAIEAGRGDEARRLAAEGQHALASKLLQWIELQLPRNGAIFEQIADFLRANPEWPGQDQLIRRAEEALSDQVADSVVLAWFGERRPATADGALRLTDALFRSGDADRATRLIRDTWRNMVMGDKQEKFLRGRHEHVLRQADHDARLDHLLWEGRRDDAQRVFSLVDPGRRALAEARLRLAAQAAGAEAAIARVPEKLRSDPGLSFERARWRRRNAQLDGAAVLLLGLPSLPNRAERIWNERALVARKLIAEGRAREAYRIARAHGLETGTGFVETEWLAGWIALRFLHDAESGLQHFKRLHDSARFPVSRSRAAYWAGRASETRGDARSAQDWYRRGAEYLTTYYGQLAWTRLDGTQRPGWPRTPDITPADRDSFNQLEPVQVVRLLQELDRLDRVKPFLLRLTAQAAAPAQHALVADLAASLGRPDLMVSVAKRSHQAGVALPEHGYPVMELPNDYVLLEPPLILATIRQESAFEADAVSRAGARGLMQLMPATARAVARELGLAHADHRLTDDTSHNIRLGSAYLSGLLDDFDGSYVLALAGYNAGPGRVRQWLREFGDPRGGGVDVVDWIELIPIEETRNYVQRVLENLQLYRLRLGQTLLARGPTEGLGWRR